MVLVKLGCLRYCTCNILSTKWECLNACVSSKLSYTILVWSLEIVGKLDLGWEQLGQGVGFGDLLRGWMVVLVSAIAAAAAAMIVIASASRK